MQKSCVKNRHISTTYRNFQLVLIRVLCVFDLPFGIKLRFWSINWYKIAFLVSTNTVVLSSVTIL